MVKCTLISINLFQSPNPILAGEGMLPLPVFLSLNITCTDDGIKIKLEIALISGNNGLQFESNPRGLANFNKHCPGPSDKPQFKMTRQGQSCFCGVEFPLLEQSI